MRVSTRVAPTRTGSPSRSRTPRHIRPELQVVHLAQNDTIGRSASGAVVESYQCVAGDSWDSVVVGYDARHALGHFCIGRVSSNMTRLRTLEKGPRTPPGLVARPRPSIRFGQNFLKDPLLVSELVSRADLTADDVVYEIGPGRGVITQALAKVCGRVIAIEVEPNLATLLRQQFRGTENIEVINADVLEFEIPNTRYKVFANIPFNITADIFRKLLYGRSSPARAYLIVQREAAEKYSGAQRECQASVLLKPWYDLRIVHRFSRSDFDPAPAVEVVLLDIKKREHPLVTSGEAAAYRQFVTYGFGRQRANLGKSYKKVFSHLQWKRLAHDLGFDVHAKPTDLSFDQWCSVFHFFLEGLKNGFAKMPAEMAGLRATANRSSNEARTSTQGLADQRWKNRKAKQAR